MRLFEPPSIVIVGTLLLSACSSSAPDGEVWLARRPAPELDGLSVTHDVPFRLTDQRGKVVLVTFGYTSCLEVCPNTLAKIGGVYQDLGDQASSFEAVYVSVDPERDVPGRFKRFLADFDSRIQGLFLEGDALASTLSAYQVVATRRAPEVRRYLGHSIDPQKDYAIDHTASLWLIDRTGRLRVKYGPKAEANRIAAGVEKLLHEGA